MYQLMYTVQLLGSRTFDSQILMHSCTPKNDINMDREFQKHLYKDDRKVESLIRGNTGKDPVK